MRRLIVALGALLANTAAAVTVSIDPATQTLALGGSANVSVRVDDSSTINAYDLGLSYDISIVSVGTVLIGSDASSAGCLFSANTLVAGKICIAIACVTPINVPNAELAVVSFNGDNIGVSPVEFDASGCSPPVSGGCVLEDSGGPVSCSTEDGSITVAAPTPTQTPTPTPVATTSCCDCPAGCDYADAGTRCPDTACTVYPAGSYICVAPGSPCVTPTPAPPGCCNAEDNCCDTNEAPGFTEGDCLGISGTWITDAVCVSTEACGDPPAVGTCVPFTPTPTPTIGPTASRTPTVSPTSPPATATNSAVAATSTPTATAEPVSFTPTPTCPPANDRRGRPNLTLCNAPCLSTPTPMAFGTPVPGFSDNFGDVKTGSCQNFGSGTAQVQFFCYAHAGPWQGTPIPVAGPVTCPGSATWTGDYELCFGRIAECSDAAAVTAWIDRVPDAKVMVGP